MEKNLIYSASLTGQPFLLFEIRQVAKLRLSDIPEDSYFEEIRTRNLFQYATEKSVRKRLNTVVKRLNVLEDPLAELLATGSLDESKIINLYSIMMTNRLVYEFIIEVIGDKYSRNQWILENQDINEFFVAKAEQSDIVAKWKDDTLKKLKQVLIRILFEAGILETIKSRSMVRRRADHRLIAHFELNGQLHVLKAMGITL